MARRKPVTWILFLVFVLMPLIEIYLLVQLGQEIGAGWVLLIVLAGVLLGAAIVRRAGSRAWAGLRHGVEQGRPPGRELADGVLTLIGGALIMAPGLISDLLGLLLVLPFTRPAFRRLVGTLVLARVAVPPGTRPGGSGEARRPGPGSDGSVVQGEVMDD